MNDAAGNYVKWGLQWREVQLSLVEAWGWYRTLAIDLAWYQLESLILFELSCVCNCRCACLHWTHFLDTVSSCESSEQTHRLQQTHGGPPWWGQRQNQRQRVGVSVVAGKWHRPQLIARGCIYSKLHHLKPSHFFQRLHIDTLNWVRLHPLKQSSVCVCNYNIATPNLLVAPSRFPCRRSHQHSWGSSTCPETCGRSQAILRLSMALSYVWDWDTG